MKDIKQQVIKFNHETNLSKDNFFISDLLCNIIRAENSPQLNLIHSFINLFFSGDSFVLDNLGCHGFETSIFDCSHNGEWNENCRANEIAGVRCGSNSEGECL